tara:strand:+ start:27 stop:773 length:747 start_codon:yes stop_codon:yes gene_type:complete
MLRVTAKQQLVREIVEVLSVLNEEAKIIWGENGLLVTIVDGSHVALLSAKIGNECFETYEVEPVEIGLELGKMKDLLSLGGSDLVEIDYDEAVGMMNVRIGSVLRILRGLDTSTMENPSLPDLEFNSRATIDSEKFSKSLRAAKFVGELVDFSIDNNQLRVSVQSEAGEGVNVKFESGELAELSCSEASQSTYSLQFLEPLTRKLASGFTDEISLQFQEKYPLKMTWKTNDGGAEWVYFLAPRVINDP